MTDPRDLLPARAAHEAMLDADIPESHQLPWRRAFASLAAQRDPAALARHLRHIARGRLVLGCADHITAALLAAANDLTPEPMP